VSRRKPPLPEGLLELQRAVKEAQAAQAAVDELGAGRPELAQLDAQHLAAAVLHIEQHELVPDTDGGEVVLGASSWRRLVELARRVAPVDPIAGRSLAALTAERVPPELEAEWQRFTAAHQAWMRTLQTSSSRRTKHDREDQDQAWQVFQRARTAWKRALDMHR
jgi:hypothetical protein